MNDTRSLNEVAETFGLNEGVKKLSKTFDLSRPRFAFYVARKANDWNEVKRKEDKIKGPAKTKIFEVDKSTFNTLLDTLYDFPAELMKYKREDTFIVVTPGSKSGLIIQPEGHDYPRYKGYINTGRFGY